MYPSTIVFLFALCSSAVATGHLRLEFTASNDCDLLLITDFSAQIISLRMGETRTSSFHPVSEETAILVAFSIGDSAPKNKTYPLELSEQPLRDVLAFSEVAVLVQSVYECDIEYYGPLCMIKKNPNAPVSTFSSSSTTSTTSTTTTTTTVISTSMATEKVSPSTSPGPVTATALPLRDETPLTNIVIIVLTIVVVCLLILIIFVCIFLLPRQQHIYIEPTIETPEMKKKKQLNDSYKCDSGFQSPESIRYTAAPFTSVTMSP